MRYRVVRVSRFVERVATLAAVELKQPYDAFLSAALAGADGVLI